MDDSGGNLGLFFEELFCSWIRGRQKAGEDPAETVELVLKWMANDNYGFCYNIEKPVVETMRKKELELFEAAFIKGLEKSLKMEKQGEKKRIYDFSYSSRHNAKILKIIYIKKKDEKSYINLCGRLGASPKDCREIAVIYKKKGKIEDALFWVKKGIELEKQDTWPNEDAYDLKIILRELYDLSGSRNMALENAWEEFRKTPSEYGYAELMKYVEKNETEKWRGKAIEEAKKAPVGLTLKLFLELKELRILSERILAAGDEELEGIHYSIAGVAAKTLHKEYPLAAARIYRSLGMHIVNEKRSSIYFIAMGHFSRVKKIYCENGMEDEWQDIVNDIKERHYRKKKFFDEFEKLVSGAYPEKKETFSKKTRKIWERQTR